MDDIKKYFTTDPQSSTCSQLPSLCLGCVVWGLTYLKLLPAASPDLFLAKVGFMALPNSVIPLK